MEYVAPDVASPGMDWSTLIPEGEWALYAEVLEALEDEGVRFALGGGFARAAYTALWRNTKDLDLYVLPNDRDTFIRILQTHGWRDYYDVVPYDRSWIYRAIRGDLIVDLIWTFPNHISVVDERWLTAGPYVLIRGKKLPIIPAEELVWAKLYVMQRERCDWPDIINILFTVGPTLDWHHLLERVGEDRPLLSGVLSVFRWLCPGRAALLPDWLWSRAELGGSSGTQIDYDPRRVWLLESRPWFCAQVMENKR